MPNRINLPNGSPNDLNIPLLIKNKFQLNTDCVLLRFERPQDLPYEPGNWLDIRFPSAELSVGKTFSFASSPTEPDLMIAFKKGTSKFKKALEETQVGDTLYITQYGSDGFLLNKKYKSLFIAGGIGITPFRSMIKEAIDTENNVEITLLYLNHTDEVPFKEELDEWKKNRPYLHILYVVTEKVGHMKKEKLIQLIPNITEFMIYIVGSPGMVTSIESIIGKLNTKSEDVKIESFDGY